MTNEAPKANPVISALVAVVIFVLALIGICFVCGAGLTAIGWFTLT